MNTSEKILVMQAWVDGKDVEIKHEDSIGWELLDKHPFDPYWDWKNCEYRIKPKPMEIQVWVNQDGALRFLKEFPSQLGMEGNGYTLKTFVEKV